MVPSYKHKAVYNIYMSFPCCYPGIEYQGGVDCSVTSNYLWLCSDHCFCTSNQTYYLFQVYQNAVLVNITQQSYQSMYDVTYAGDWYNDGILADYAIAPSDVYLYQSGSFIADGYLQWALENFPASYFEQLLPPYPTLQNGVAMIFGGLLNRTDEFLINSQTIGYESLKYAQPMRNTSLFRMGSNSKLVCTVALYKLQEMGKLNVSHNVADYLNATDFVHFGFPNITRYCPVLQSSTSTPSTVCQNLTFVNLMAMQSGIVDMTNCEYQNGQWELIYCWQPWREQYPGNGNLDLTIGYFINAPLSFAPGTSYHYANENFLLLGYLVQKISGMPYGQFVRKYIFQPLGMNQTFSDASNQQHKLWVSAV
jgi:Beta-lactamase